MISAWWAMPFVWNPNLERTCKHLILIVFLLENNIAHKFNFLVQFVCRCVFNLCHLLKTVLNRTFLNIKSYLEALILTNSSVDLYCISMIWGEIRCRYFKFLCCSFWIPNRKKSIAEIFKIRPSVNLFVAKEKIW